MYMRGKSLTQLRSVLLASVNPFLIPPLLQFLRHTVLFAGGLQIGPICFIESKKQGKHAHGNQQLTQNLGQPDRFRRPVSVSLMAENTSSNHQKLR